jgi:hypothetical protein
MFSKERDSPIKKSLAASTVNARLAAPVMPTSACETRPERDCDADHRVTARRMADLAVAIQRFDEA